MVKVAIVYLLAFASILASELTVLDGQSPLMTDCLSLARDNIGDRPWQKLEFNRIKENAINLGYSKDAVWLHCQFQVANEGEYFFSLEYTVLENVTFRLYENDRLIKSLQTGLAHNYETRQVNNRYFVLQTELNPATNYRLLVKVESETSLTLPLRIYNQQKFAEKNNNENLIYGVFIGIMGIMVLYNLFIFIVLKSKTYLYYIAYLALHFFGQLNYYGFFNPILWPESPWWATHSYRFFAGLVMVASALFASRFLRIKSYLPKFTRLYNALYLLLAVQLVSCFTASGAISAALTSMVAITMSICFIWAGIFTWRAGFTPARYFLLAWFSFIAGSQIFLLRTYDVLPSNFIFDNGMLLGACVEVLLLSIALADRINVIKNERLEAQAALLERSEEVKRIQENINKELEKKSE